VTSRGNRWKRGVDIFGGGALLLLSAPVQAVVALLVLVGDGPPVLFRHHRVGYRGRPLRLVKFRTMRPGDGTLVTAAGDPRITPLGLRLRRYKLDELPQLWQVVSGAMSLVGPRPEVPRYVARYQSEYRRLGDLRPGLTDLASLVFRDEEEILARHAAESGFYEERLLPRKLALARLYRRHLSPGFDLRLIAATACVVGGRYHTMQALVGRSLWQRAREGL
jgi:lipopolysaccharide/colanic/teichoic acid biosynthesis glycosyltransferase